MRGELISYFLLGERGGLDCGGSIEESVLCSDEERERKNWQLGFFFHCTGTADSCHCQAPLPVVALAGEAATEVPVSLARPTESERYSHCVMPTYLL